MNILFLFLILIFNVKISDSTDFFNSSVQKVNSYKTDHLLLRNLLQNYNKKIRPLDTVQVTLLFFLCRIDYSYLFNSI